MTTINRRNFLKIGVAAGIGLAMPRGVMAQVTPPPPPTPSGPQHLLEHKVTIADRKAAVANNKAAGFKPGAAAGPTVADIPGLPHYFGPFANYANSPMPRGSIGSVVVDNAGTGYTAPTVEILDVYGTGTGATASASVVGGLLTSITVTAPGSGYTAPIVSITDASGEGAAATAVLELASGPYNPLVTRGIRKFVNSLAGLYPTGVNDLGNYISVAVPDQDSYPGSDYYEIGLVQYTHQFHSDMPPTLLRGYVQLGTDVVPGSVALFNEVPDMMGMIQSIPLSKTGVDMPHYLGPLIVASKGTPVRIKFYNLLPTGMDGNLFIPVDKTVMGAGMGPEPMAGMPEMMEDYTQNRATLHLHGGLVPWISDGTPHQWCTPAGEDTPYPQGVSVVAVPDMAADDPGDPRDGIMSFYYNNEQSARLMFYHDHAYGITRLNVYAGEAAGYLLTDQVEQDLINGTNITGVNPGLLNVLPDIGVPLVIQDKTFVDADTIGAQDPMWKWGSGPVTNPDPMDMSRAPATGDLWVPNVYMPAQNPGDVSGANAFGRWQYGPWFWPPTSGIAFGPVANEYYDPQNAPLEPPMRPQMPWPSMGMEAFNDTPLVNGVAYPYVELPAAPIRFRILNAANDRFFNLHFYEADPSVVTADGRANTEVKMVPATIPGWSVDGREGGVPDPATKGPDWIQIGNEGGFLPAPVVIPPQPINWNMNATAFNVGNVTDHSLLLGCAERADVIVDFTPYAGKTLILYNDAPTAFPALDPRYDYYTGDPDFTDSGGTPTTQPGFGPNTRTVMQVRIQGDAAGAALAGIAVRSGGSDYSAAPSVVIEGGGAPTTPAAATATCSIDHITVNATGSGYGTTPPIVTIAAPTAGVTATATANLTNGRVTSITITNPGSGYTSAPAVSFDSGTATATVALTVSSIALTDPGAGYTSVPTVSLEGGGGYGATAVASLVISGVLFDVQGLMDAWRKNSAANKLSVFEVYQDSPLIPQAAYNSAYEMNVADDMSQYIQLHDFNKSFFNGPLLGLQLLSGGSGYTNPPTVTFTGGGGVNAAATATISPTFVNSVTLLNRGSGYTSAPLVSFSGGTPTTPATAIASFTRVIAAVTVVNGGTGYNNTVRIEFQGGGGTGAAATATIGAGGVITGITVTNGGSGYTSAPQVRIRGGNGRNATATASITGVVSGITLTNGGAGYTATPTVNFTGGGGTGAAAAATIQPGFVTSLTLDNPGSGYTSAPTIGFTGGGPGVTVAATAIALGITIGTLQPKAIHDEMGAAYDIDYGRMGGLLGLELPVTNSLNQNMVLFGYATPPVDLIQNSVAPLGTLGDGTEIWRITQNGVDTHPMHFHLFNVQVINRVAWDGAMLPPDPNEVGWKETVRTNPLEHLVVALRPVMPPNTPFDLPNSIRAIDPTMPLGEVLRGGPNGFVDPGGTAAPVTNRLVNFGWEYVWHCHILSHEEMDMMHPLVFGVAPNAPTNLTAVYSNPQRRVTLSWRDNASNETGFTIQRASSQAGPWTTLAVTNTVIAGTGGTGTYVDTTVLRNRTYYYRVMATNVIGDTTVYAAPAIGYPTKAMNSAPSNLVLMSTSSSGAGTPLFATTFNAGLAGWAGVVGNVAVGAPAGAMALASAELDQVMIATIEESSGGASAMPAYVYDNSPDMEPIYFASFMFDPNDAVSGDGPVDIFVGLNQDNLPIFGIQYEKDEESGTFEIRGWFEADGQQVFTDMVEIANGANLVEMAWQSDARGSFSLFLDEQHIKTLSGDTSAHKVNEVLLGPSMGLSKSSSGSMYFDEFTSSRILAGMNKKLFLGWLSR